MLTSSALCILCLTAGSQYYQTAEDLGLYGQDPTATASKGVFVATGADTITCHDLCMVTQCDLHTTADRQHTVTVSRHQLPT
jgi:hypothetical protein